jgi:hypothetical protein
MIKVTGYVPRVAFAEGVMVMLAYPNVLESGILKGEVIDTVQPVGALVVAVKVATPQPRLSLLVTSTTKDVGLPGVTFMF